jgi:dTDP-4-amino-4,6-dideoxygalactose transaminase
MMSKPMSQKTTTTASRIGWKPVPAARSHAARYWDLVRGITGVAPPVTDPANEHIFHQYTVRAERRDALAAHLRDRGIGCAVYYPTGLHLQPCFAHLGFVRGSLPETERAMAEVLSLPIFPELTAEQQDEVVSAVREFYA